MSAAQGHDWAPTVVAKGDVLLYELEHLKLHYNGWMNWTGRLLEAGWMDALDGGHGSGAVAVITAS